MWGDRSGCQRENKTSVGYVHIVRGWARNDLLGPLGQIPSATLKGEPRGQEGESVTRQLSPSASANASDQHLPFFLLSIARQIRSTNPSLCFRSRTEACCCGFYKQPVKEYTVPCGSCTDINQGSTRGIPFPFTQCSVKYTLSGH